MSRPPELVAFVELFNAGQYWESHEAIEALWKVTAGPQRLLYQGLIQAAGAMVHWTRHNNHGIRVLGAKAKSKLLPHRPNGAGLDLQAFVWDLEHCLFRGGAAPVLRWAEST